MRNPSILAAALALYAISLHADSAPALQWVQATGGSGVDAVIGAAADSQGNFYIAGNTTSLDFPVTAALQSAAGGSTLVRIDTATGTSQKLFPSGLSAATSLAADPRNPRTLYATAGNAVWRSVDAGNAWAMLSQFASGVTVNCLAVDPSNGNNLYAGTAPQGAFKSADGGLTWTAIDSGIVPGQYGTNVSLIAVDPNAPQVIFASGPLGLLRSPDGGSTWKLAVSADYLFNTLVFDPFVPGTIYLAVSYTILKSTDDGLTFTPQFSVPSYNSLTAMAADPFHPGVLFAACSTCGVYQSSDSGATWTQKSAQAASLLAADPLRPVMYAYSASGVVQSADGFATASPIGLPETSMLQLLAAGSNLFALATPSNDVFVVKLDPNGNVVYSTYFGGSGDDSATGMAVGADGSVYVTGGTNSADFPTTAGAYLPTRPPSTFPEIEPFLFKLNPDGSLGWSTYFSDYSRSANAIAVDSGGNPYVATAVEGQCVEVWPIGCFPGPPSISVTKFNAKGTGLVYSTQAYTASGSAIYSTTPAPQTLAIDPGGNAYVAGYGNIALLNSTGTAVLALTALPNGLAIDALALDANSNLFATGWWTNFRPRRERFRPGRSRPCRWRPGMCPAAAWTPS